MINSTASEPWSFGEDVEEISRNYIKLRYKLLPLFYSAFYQSHLTGLPVAKSLAIDYPFDDHIYQDSYENEFLCCDSLLVVPVVSFKDITKAYLPAGTWYYFYTDKIYAGNQEIYVDCPLTYLPVFVKGGAVLTLQESTPHTDYRKMESLNIHVYKGSGITRFMHYEDIGDGWEFMEGAHFKREILLNSDSNELLIGTAEGTLESRYAQLTIFFHGFDQKGAVVDGKEMSLASQEVTYLQKVSDFDPLPNDKHTFHTCKQVSYLQLKHTITPMTIQLT
jgi:alpha-glucosidase